MMKSKEEIQKKLDSLKSDKRLEYLAANVFINAPLALVQTQLESMVDVLEWVLRDEPQDKDGIK